MSDPPSASEPPERHRKLPASARLLGLACFLATWAGLTVILSGNAAPTRSRPTPAAVGNWWVSDAALLRRYLDGKYEHVPVAMVAGHRGKADVGEQERQRLMADWREFMGDRDRFVVLPLMLRESQQRWRDFLRQKYGRGEEGLERLGKAWGGTFVSWQDVTLRPDVETSWPGRRWLPPSTRRRSDYEQFLRSLPPDRLLPVGEQVLWTHFLEAQKSVPESLGGNRQGSARPVRPPSPKELRESEPHVRLWGRFLRERWPLWMVRLKPAATELWPAFLEEQCGSVDELNARLGTRYKTFQNVPLPPTAPSDPAFGELWTDFADGLDPNLWERESPERRWGAFLEDKHGGLREINAALGTSYSQLERIPLPLREADRWDFRHNRWALRWAFTEEGIRAMGQDLAPQSIAELIALATLAGLTLVGAAMVNPRLASLLRSTRRGVWKGVALAGAVLLCPPAWALVVAGHRSSEAWVTTAAGAAILANLLGVLSLRRLVGPRAVLGQATWLFWAAVAWAVLLLHGPATVRLTHAMHALAGIISHNMAAVTVGALVAALPAVAGWRLMAGSHAATEVRPGEAA